MVIKTNLSKLQKKLPIYKKETVTDGSLLNVYWFINIYPNTFLSIPLYMLSHSICIHSLHVSESFLMPLQRIFIVFTCDDVHSDAFPLSILHNHIFLLQADRVLRDHSARRMSILSARRHCAIDLASATTNGPVVSKTEVLEFFPRLTLHWKKLPRITYVSIQRY